MAVPLDPLRFQGTAAFYERCRLAFPERLIQRVAGLAELKPGDAVLDLGCGSGMLAVPFAQAGMAVTAMDPEAEMLAATRKAADAAGVRVTLQQASSYDLTPDMGPFRLVVIGRAFHWMDRAATLTMLERIVTPDGGVALFHDAHPPVEENAWFKTVCDISARHRPKGAERGGGHRRYEPFLLASAFTQLDGLSVTIRQSVSVDEIVGRAFSMSASICDRDALAAELTAALRESSPDGKFTEVAELVALLARRPR
ncbi:MAG: methyltransferase domain-containing protein [Pseudomonadota bacterium]